MKTLKQFKKEAFKNPGVKKAYVEMQPEMQIIRALILSRNKKGMSQRKLAQKIGVTQSALARFETGGVNPTLSFLQKITNGLGLKLVVK
ncbi:MAG TPA: helix-turn-helix transcriptional regulator [Candidatus Paceibacterota bacterium]|jgi:predicted transcriptional regulator|nr:helix-turn-helix transcriptional regulator [Candidatus Paceibacterota bacterium]